MRLEDVASAANIVRRTRTRFNRDSTSSLNKLDEEQISIYKIVEAAEKGDDFASLMLERTGSYVGTAIATVINLLNIEKIVIGGEIMHAGHLVLDAVMRRATRTFVRPVVRARGHRRRRARRKRGGDRSGSDSEREFIAQFPTDARNYNLTNEKR